MIRGGIITQKKHVQLSIESRRLKSHGKSKEFKGGSRGKPYHGKGAQAMIRHYQKERRERKDGKKKKERYGS